MAQDTPDDLRDLFSGKPIDEKWVQDFVEGNRKVREETSLDFDWDIEALSKESLKIDAIEYEPLDITETSEDRDNFTQSNSDESLDHELLDLFD